MYRMTQEPDLKEWTRRAESCDMLHEPVGSPKQISILLSMIVHDSYICYCSLNMAGSYRLSGEIYMPFRFLSLYSKGGASFYFIFSMSEQYIA